LGGVGNSEARFKRFNEFKRFKRLGVFSHLKYFKNGLIRFAGLMVAIV
jgi:hypothetical protein